MQTEEQHLFPVGDPKPAPEVEELVDDLPKREIDHTEPFPFEPLAGAEISADGVYRYSLWRRLLEKGKTILFVGLNPSTADAQTDDPTIRAMCDFAKRWGYANVVVANLFAFRATDPAQLKAASDPVGPMNLETVVKLRKSSDLCIACWGNGGALNWSGRRMFKALVDLGPVHCLVVNKSGHPKHPLYVSRSTEPRVFSYQKLDDLEELKELEEVDSL